MIKAHLLFYSIFICCTLQAQKIYICTEFDTGYSFIQIDTSQTWQVGQPNKANFDSTLYGNRSLMTDTVNPYPINDTSSFIAKIYPTNVLWGVNEIRISFYHRFQTDTLIDNCLIDLSIDGGNSWIDVLSDSLSTSTNYFHFITLDTLIYDTLPITGNSFGWVYSIFAKDVWDIKLFIDSVLIRFTFVSDSIQTNKDGWQIDKLCLEDLHIFSTPDLTLTKKTISIYPNPAKKYLTIEFKNSENEIYELRIYNIYGRLVFKKNKISSGKVELAQLNLTQGTYFYNLFTSSKLIGTGKIMIE